MSGKERRRHTRHKTPESCFAALRAESTTVGRIRDISKGGLSFEYLEDVDAPAHSDGGESVDLFMTGGGLFVRQIPCQTVRDNLAMHDDLTFSGIGIRRRGLQFEELNEQASHEVEAYIALCSRD
ncbi:PilZ domain-containing protein [Desulfatibacillum aliphaticivorans]|uniref:PilZ domain-containing protein n=1 Tax=Desulfatibacillum aliphaticivorans TaxID=218208 RepID=UPI00040A0A50|nr:PilZ domain-containing protein [Desulfatibacillum aliphaticivorans]